MKFVIFGLTVSSSWGNHHAGLWRGLCRSLAQRGHKVVFFERDQTDFAARRDLGKWRDGELWLFSDFEKIRYQARRHLANADVAIVTSFCADALAATELVLDSAAAMRAFYDFDTALTLAAAEMGKPVDYIGSRGLADFDLVLSATGGRALDELQAKLGARRVAPFYHSVDPEIYQRRERDARFASDVSFLGDYRADQRALLEKFFLSVAREHPERRFLLGGARYPADFSPAGNSLMVDPVDEAERVACYSSSRLTLNLTRPAMKVWGYCPSMRLFEAAACGVPMVSDEWAGLELFFEPGAELIRVSTRDELTAALELPDAALAQMARRARERVLDEHTSAHRARHLEAIIENTMNAATEAELTEVSEKLSVKRDMSDLVEA